MPQPVSNDVDSTPDPSSLDAQLQAMGGDTSPVDPGVLLEQIEHLPTLNSIAVRILQLTSDAGSHADDVTQLIETDPALASRVLRLCRCSERGRAANVTTIERAVLLLGFDAVRAAVLSVEFVDTFKRLNAAQSAEGADGEEADQAFDLRMYWRHALTVAELSRDLASAMQGSSRVDPSEAFLAGLLHDLGLLALHVVAPEPMDEARRWSEQSSHSFNTTCRERTGLDPATAGRRLAELWQLPASYVNAIWLHQQHPNAVPDSDDALIIQVVGLANALALQHALPPLPGLRGDDPADIETRTRALSLDVAAVSEIVTDLPVRVDELAESLGLDCTVSTNEVLVALGRANSSLGRVNQELRTQADVSVAQSNVIGAVRRFLESTGGGDPSIGAALRRIVAAAAQDQRRVRASLHQRRDDTGWVFSVYDRDGRVIASRVLEPRTGESARRLIRSDECELTPMAMAFLPSVERALDLPRDSELSAVPLGCTGAVQVVLLIEESSGSPMQSLHPLLRSAWDSAVQAASSRESASFSAESLASANIALSEMQEELTHARLMSSLGEVAAGAAHEMNNPLTIISGRAQLLEHRLAGTDLESVAELIATSAEELSGMISALRQFAEAAEVEKSPTDLYLLCEGLVLRLRNEHPRGTDVGIQLLIPQGLPAVVVDPRLLSDALWEVIRNAAEAPEATRITIDAQIDPGMNRLRIDVRDDGSGLSDHAMQHAFDPFFSDKRSGRQPGLGLSKVRRIVEAHRGTVALRHDQSSGTVVSIALEDAVSSARLAS